MKTKNMQISGLIAAVLLLGVYLALFIGGTYAWFSETAKLEGNRIESGTLDMQLDLVSGNDYTVDHQTAVAVKNVVTAHTFTDSDATPLIELANIQPGDNGNRVMKITNKGNVAFTNIFTITVVDNDTTDSIVPADYLVIELYVDGTLVNGTPTATGIEFDLGNCNAKLSADDDVDNEITFEMRYIMKNVGNEFMGKGCTIDFTLFSEQLKAENFDTFVD